MRGMREDKRREDKLMKGRRTSDTDDSASDWPRRRGTGRERKCCKWIILSAALTVMGVGCMTDLHHIIGEQHLMSDGLGHTGPKSDECRGGVFVVSTKG